MSRIRQSSMLVRRFVQDSALDLEAALVEFDLRREHADTEDAQDEEPDRRRQRSPGNRNGGGALRLRSTDGEDGERRTEYEEVREVPAEVRDEAGPPLTAE